MNVDTSPSLGRRRLLVLVATVLGVLGIVAWALVAAGGADRSTAGAADRVSSSTTATSLASPADPTTSQPSDAPTVMPDGAPIPSPSPGTPDTIGEGETETVEPVSTLPPVGLDETGDFGTGLSVQLTEIASVQGVARAPGEIAGPALEVTVEAVNDSTEAVSFDGVVVFLSYGSDLIPAASFGQGSAPLTGSLGGGSAATGTYVFAVPEEQRDEIRVEVSYTGEAPTVVFTGSVD